jgi:hypothetical protein
MTPQDFNKALQDPKLQSLLDQLVEQREAAEEMATRADPIARKVFDMFNFEVDHWDDLYLVDDEAKCDTFYRQVDAAYRLTGLLDDSQVWGTWPQLVEHHKAINLEGDILQYFGPEFYSARLDLRDAFLDTLLEARRLMK